MRKTIRRGAGVLLTTATLVATVGLGTAQAAATDRVKSEAGQAVIDGTATQRQRDLVARDPQLSRVVPVTYQASPAVVERAAVSTSATAAAQARAACPAGTKYVVTAQKTITAKSTLGFTTFKYHHKVRYCESGTRFLKFLDRSQWFTDEDWVVNAEGLVQNSKSVSNGRGYTKVKRKVIITNFLGDDWIIYPWIAGNFKPGDINWSGNPDNQF